ncbi:VOC family protein [Ramlibacter humi]|uniref:VOC family protein n=1 Tax=Ramlibacter humi TaxID=2530451 RepID=A0A4Z0C023_9BURK|nr:VOC family protein [Ramlibacter humi]TFZ03880.1 VOC family protein [Ramlibacter humi]
MPKTSTCLWFDRDPLEAAELYVSVFPNSRITAVTHYEKNSPMPEGAVLTVTFEIDGRSYTLLHGGPVFKLSPAASIVVHCKDQAEVDRYWQALSAVPQAEQCGWLQDRFGVSWQIVPERLFEMLLDPDAGKRRRTTDAFMKMKKFDLAALERAYAG